MRVSRKGARRSAIFVSGCAVILATLAGGFATAGAESGITPGAPNTPTGVTVRVGPPNYFATISWKPAATGPAATGYQLLIAPYPGRELASRFDVGASSTSFVWSGGTPGRNYFVLVQAKNTQGLSRASGETYFGLPDRAPLPTRPFGSWTQVVTRDHRDFLGDAPTTAQLGVALTFLNQAGSNVSRQNTQRLNLAYSFVGQVLPSEGSVLRLYRAYFRRDPDLGGLDYWTTRLIRGTRLTTVSESFASSSEFRRTYGALDAGEFVDLIYTNVLARVPDATGRAFWVRRLEGAGNMRAKVMIGFSESPEFKESLEGQVLTTVAYRHMIKRLPTSSEIVALPAGTRAGLAYFGSIYWKLIDSEAYLKRGLTP